MRRRAANMAASAIHSHVSVSYPGDGTQQAIAEQRRADTGDVGGVLTDPERVAVESLKSLYPGQAPFLRSVKKTSARQVFRWKKDKNQMVVVVTRPYWLSLLCCLGLGCMGNYDDQGSWLQLAVREGTSRTKMAE
jgi:hypothetical protein